MASLTTAESNRYARHIIMPSFGLENQLKLKGSSVVVVGAGGLGAPALLYLAAAGIGKLGIIDLDQVELSNLQRQVIFTMDDIGKNKALAAAERLQARNPEVSTVPHAVKITSANALELLAPYDVVIDGTDNFPTRYLLNDACVLLNKPLVYGSILQFEGQAAVFNLKRSNGTNSTHYRDLFPEPPDPASVPNCEQAGVLGILPGIIGTIQATEAIKIITGIGEPLADTLLLVDALEMDFTKVKLVRRGHVPITTLIDYEEFCGISGVKDKSLNSTNNNNETMKEITVQELKAMKDQGADFQLIDVREPHEYEFCNLEGELIPQAEVPSNLDKIDRTKQVVVYCRSGSRSGNMVQWLERHHGFENLYNLKGGIIAWSKEIDPTVPVY
jgi:adenylyltransferase/sulfurtransferase